MERHSPAEPGSASRRGEPIHCAHCGQPVFHGGWGNPAGESFCCDGCLRVHALLGGAKWGRYYDLLGQSGKQAPRARLGEGYRAFLDSLDDPGTLAAIGRWDLRRHSVSLECREITCAGCAWLLENLLREMPGARGFEVDFLHGEAFLEYDSDKTALKDILESLGGFGYRLRPKSESAPERPVPNRALLYRLAVSAACFLNSMAFSLAVYAGAFHGMARDWMSAFGTLGFLLSVPAILYCAFPFYAGAWQALRARRFNVDVTVTLGILISFSLSFLSALQGGASNFSDSLTGLIFFLLLGRWGVRRFEAGLALKGRWFDALRPDKIRVQRALGTESVDRDAVVSGDRVEVLAGEYVPVDGTLDAREAWMDTSLLTGESKAMGLRYGDGVFAGYLNLKGRITVRTMGAAGATRIASLGKQLEDLARGRRAPYDGTGAVARWFTLAVAACALFAAGMHASEGWMKAFTVSASVFIISCSCALALAAPISRGLGLRRAKALGFHFRSQTTLESLRDIRCVLFDKTGTLTFIHRTLSSLVWLDPWTADEQARNAALGWLHALAKRSLHPVSLSLCSALETLEPGPHALEKFEEIPHFGLVGKSAHSGFREICLCRYGSWEEGNGPFAKLGYAKPDLERTAHGSPLPESCLFLDGRLAALIRFTEEIKPEVFGLVAELRKQGIALALLSGDNEGKVAAFARSCGITDFHAALTPEEKCRWAGIYNSKHGRCLAVGDGFNDSLLFGASDLAMAVEGGAVDLLDGVDILFTGKRPSDIGKLFTLSRRVNRSIRLCFWASGVYNIAAIGIAFQGWVTPLSAAILMPVSSLSLCIIAVLAIPRDRTGSHSDACGQTYIRMASKPHNHASRSSSDDRKRSRNGMP